MIKKQRGILTYLEDIYREIKSIENFIKDISLKEFEDDLKTQYAVTRSLEIIGEATKNIPFSYRTKYKNIPWRSMAGMRDILIHQYYGVEINTLWKTVFESLPKINPLIKELIEKTHE